MNASKKYQCSGCDKLHDDEWDAEECCTPEVFTVFVCGKCEANFDAEADAVECCASAAEESGEPMSPDVYRQRIKDLESAGQIRLPL